MFVVASVIYRPIEQLLSRTIADRRARGLTGGHNLRVALLIQAAFALTFLVVALALRDLLQNDLFDGSAALYWVLVVGVLAYAASYFARGFLAGHQRFELYGAARLPGGGLAGLLRAGGRRRDRVGPVGGRAGHGGRAAHVAARRAVVLRAPRRRPAARSERGHGEPRAG